MDNPQMLLTIKKVGNDAFKDKDYHKAIAIYTKGLSIEPTNTDLLSNRAAAYLNFGLYSKALLDTETVLSSNPRHKKCLYRKVKALWGLCRYVEAQNFIKQFNIKNLSDKADTLVTQSQGNFKISEIKKLPNQARLDLANYRGPIEISPVEGKGRGILATDCIPVGTLILVEKAFCIVFDEDVDLCKKHHLTGKHQDDWSDEDTLVIRTAAMLKIDESLKEQIFDLYSGPDSLENMTDNDLMKTKSIVGLNFFSCSADESIVTAGKPNNAGLWVLPSYLNHSCPMISCLCYMLKGEWAEGP
ncbi:SET and MYND domain-containing protein 4 [Folsomia candida]|uniref:Small glutamine-rich tetratricopeptide repeat-containing protein 2 n=1 Tax=Folsomia candida TaxID=158441 RepID=A0A226DW72_FOLCA|nr:SET and MYND domain-containing protein 4 [Folsomia candida]XP_035711281.1 SET and MYND domain-containing protein 4 [Folsomia candida]OXA49722.1 Small glutamine-rich tetratricopeptide repeat-containing protein 2 [Folsomia candida]